MRKSGNAETAVGFSGAQSVQEIHLRANAKIATLHPLIVPAGEIVIEALIASQELKTRMGSMDKKKQKQKDRERRVAKQKLVDAEKRRALSKEDEASGKTSGTKIQRGFAAPNPKVDNRIMGGAKPQVTHRRAGG
ncbi:MAG: hypothetical protein JNL58_28705 [Planctomyces sp.]|nr:hypothetical protein [Planctomyces sp.]